MGWRCSGTREERTALRHEIDGLNEQQLKPWAFAWMGRNAQGPSDGRADHVAMARHPCRRFCRFQMRCDSPSGTVRKKLLGYRAFATASASEALSGSLWKAQ